MFDRNQFRGKVIAAGYTLAEVAEKLKINPATLTRKMAGESEFTRAELQKIRALLCLSADEFDAIFFANELTETQVEEDS